MRRIITCGRCKRDRPHNAKGLCGGCYQTVLYQTNARAREAAKRRTSDFQKSEVGREARRGWYRAKSDAEKERRSRKALNAKYKRLFGMNLEDVERALKSQGMACGICRRHLPSIFEWKSGRRTPDASVADHCHATGKFRGVLCNHCNRGLAFFRDSPEYLSSAAAYITEARATCTQQQGPASSEQDKTGSFDFRL